MASRIARLVLCVCASARPAPSAAQEADLLITNARVWTGDSAAPWAQAVAVRGDRILAAGTSREMARHRTARTRVLDLGGRFAMPGFIDNHTHFAQAGALLLGANLLDVSDDASLTRRVREAQGRLPRGAWITGGDWGAYALNSPAAQWSPHRNTIDSITPATPVLLSKWDRSQYLANARALQVSGVGCEVPGVECEGGEPTGRLTPAAADRVRRAIPPKAMAQRLAEARVALAQLAGFGVTGIHDITGPEQFAVYHALHDSGQLTTRVFARPTLDRIAALRNVGVQPGTGDDWIRIGALKGFVDGIMGNSSARFYQAYLTTGVRGSWRTMMTEPPGMEPLLFAADSAGWWPNVHAIGDEAIDTLLAMMERVIRVNGPRERRWRMIHTQVIRGSETARRLARLGVVAEVQPYHAIDDMRWMEQRIGARGRWAYAFRTLQQAGVRLSFGSDWPGTNASWYTSNPLHGVYAAVTRQTLEGLPAAGWFPEERVDVETALRAYTVNNAWAAGEEDRKGRIAPGLLADVVVLDADPFRVPPSALKDVRVLITVVGGRIVHDAR